MSDRDTAAYPAACVYVLKLRRLGTDAIIGRVEHVLSGRRHDIDSGAALLSCLRHEQSLQDAPARPDGSAGTGEGLAGGAAARG